jgi:hypothetical protein
VLDLALAAGYATGVARIRRVRDGFPKPWNALACVQELDERLALPLVEWSRIGHRRPRTGEDGRGGV